MSTARSPTPRSCIGRPSTRPSSPAGSIGAGVRRCMPSCCRSPAARSASPTISAGNRCRRPREGGCCGSFRRCMPPKPASIASWSRSATCIRAPGCCGLMKEAACRRTQARHCLDHFAGERRVAAVGELRHGRAALVQRDCHRRRGAEKEARAGHLQPGPEEAGQLLRGGPLPSRIRRSACARPRPPDCSLWRRRACGPSGRISAAPTCC